MLTLVEDNIYNSFVAMFTGSTEHSEEIARNEAIIDFTNSELTKYLIKLSTDMEESDETMTTKTTANSAVVFLFTTNYINDSCHNISFVLYL